MRCKLEKCVSGMKRTGWVPWSSRVWKKVQSLPTELLTRDLLAGNKKQECQSTLFGDCDAVLTERMKIFKATLTSSIILSPPFASLPLLIAHLPLCTLRTQDREVTVTISNSTSIRSFIVSVRERGETYLVAENLDLARSSVYELVGSRAEVVSVDLDVERQAFHSLLRGEVSAQGVDANVHL